jgi:catechol 2,3-dioxygenase-like lactoylglutathione lyase family enzyme
MLVIHHVSVCVSDLDRARRFYSEVVGLRELPRPDLGFPGAWYGVGDTQELHLIVHPPSKTMRGTQEIDGRDGHFAFRVDSYDGMLARLRAHGVELIERTRNATPWDQIYVADPDGNVIEFNVERANR